MDADDPWVGKQSDVSLEAVIRESCFQVEKSTWKQLFVFGGGVNSPQRRL